MVALQILVCKASRGRRQLFRSAPLHRWLEKRGQSAETDLLYFVSLPCWAWR